MVIVSVLAAVALSAPVPALAARGLGLAHRLAVAALLALAVLVLHFTAMAAVVLVPDPLVAVPLAPQPRWLAVAVTAVATGILALCLGGSIVEQNLALRAAKGRRLRELADAALEGLVIHERGRVLAANRAFAALLGRAEGDLAGAKLGTLLPLCVLSAGSSPTLITFEGAGGPALVEAVARPLTYEGRPATVLALRDLSAQHRAEAALRDSEERLRLAVEATGLGIWDVDPASGARRWSDEFRAILGLAPEVPADPELFVARIHPDDRAWVVDRYRRAYEPASGGRYEAEFRVVRAADSAERWVEATGRVFFDAAGRPMRAVGTLADVTERRQAHEALRESEERYRALVETSPDAVFAHLDGVIVFANAQAAQLFGAASPEELIGRSIFGLVDEASLPLARARTATLTVPGGRAGLAELTYRRLDGTPFPVEATAAAVLVDGRLVVQVVFRDVMARKVAEAELRRAHERLARHMNNTPLGVIELAHGASAGKPWRVRAWSGQAEAIFGWTAGQAAGRTLEELALVHEGDHGKQVLVQRDLLEEHRPRAVATMRCYTQSREIRHCRFHASLVRGSDGQPVTALLLVEDITEHLATQENIHRLAHHDVLTGLPNRILFQDRLGQALARDRREGGKGALMLLDVDQFKEINDSLGHAAGDQLLRELATRLSKVVREADTLARLGGDEFALIQTALADAGAASLLAQRIAHALERPFQIEDQQLNIAASIGITIFPDDGTTPERLMRNADMALYQAKAAGRNRYAYYRADMDRELQASRSLQRGLRQALEEDRLKLVFQPVFDLPDGRLSKVEALLRWPHPGGGQVPPSTFIPIAESSGLIRPLGDWVLQRACRQAAAWQAGGIDLKLAVNVSAAQLRQPELLETVERALADNRLDPKRLELEITESVFLDPSKDLILELLRRVAELGVTLAIDDFGTGYSSLAYLKHFPFHEIKVDGSFVRDIENGADGAAIVMAVVALGHSLGKRVTAEGVETEAQLAFLRERGCDAAQGYLLGRPSPAEAVGRLLAEGA